MSVVVPLDPDIPNNADLAEQRDALPRSLSG
jgi:hypothetical protein